MISRFVLHTLRDQGLLPYGIGLLAGGIATGVQLAFRSFFLGVPFLLYFPATILAAFFGGWRAGLICTLIGAIAAPFAFLAKPDAFLLGGSDVLRLFVFVVACLLIVGLVAALQRVSVGLAAARDRLQLMTQETDHRVANSLQLISSMLQLQASAASPDLRDGLRAALNRVAAIGRVHRRLYKSTGERELPIADYLEDICRDIAEQIDAKGKLRVTCDDIRMPVERVIKVGLIVNELVVNAFKHVEGELEIVVECHDRGREFALRVIDHGQGFPESFDPAVSKGLGMRLVAGLTAELNGRVSLDRTPGRAAVEITIPV